MDFKLVSEYQPRGDQVTAIDELVRGVEEGEKHQVFPGTYKDVRHRELLPDKFLDQALDEMSEEDLQVLSKYSNCIIYPPMAYISSEATENKQKALRLCILFRSVYSFYSTDHLHMNLLYN